MVPMVIWLTVAAFCLLGLNMLYHLYLAFLVFCFASFVVGGPGTPGGNGSGLMALHELLATVVVAVAHSSTEVCQLHEDNTLHS